MPPCDLWPVLGMLWTAAWTDRVRTSAALALLIVAKIAAVMVPLALKAVVDEFDRANVAGAAGGGAPAVTLPVFLLLGYALLRFASTLFTELRDLVFSRVALRSVAAFGERAFSHLLSLGSRFHAERNTGVVIRDLERGTASIAFLLGAGLFTLLPTLVEFVAVLAVMMAAGYSGWFTVAIAVTFFFYAAYTGVLTRRRERLQRATNEIDSLAHGRMVDGLLNHELVTANARQDDERERYAQVRTRWVEAAATTQRALSALHVGQSAIIAGGVAAVMLLAGQLTLLHRMSVGDLVLVNAYLIQICLPLNALGFVFRQALDAIVDAERVFQLLHAAPEVAERADARSLALQGGDVVFDHVDFAYEAGRPILRDFNLRLPAGGTVAVVGGSGSGKSTLARLMMRLYDPLAGRVTIDGQDLRGLTLASLHAAIGVVSQDTALFNESIAYNIGYGRPAAGLAQIIEAAKAAQVHEFIVSLPQQYDTVVGERGVKLSGGERQRIAIARALLKNPPIMILDEATSALDTRAERAIQGELDRIAVGRTTLVIAHRLSTVVGADLIVALDQGRIVESGRHDELLERNGLYAQLWNLQAQQRELARLERRLARQPLNLAVLVAGLVDALRAPIEQRGITLYTDIDTASTSVSGDPGALAQALHELGLQALRATPARGRIEIRLDRHEANARLAITDGRDALKPDAAPPAELQPDKPPMDPLALRSTIERQGGRFAIELPRADRGMRFVVELPLQPLTPPAPPLPPVPPRAAEPSAAPPAPRLAGLTVMCIDDLPDALQAVAELLELEGAQVLPFTSGRAALAWFEAHPTEQWPRLLVCDISLGDEDGRDVVRRLRQLEAQRGIGLDRRVAAIALTGFARAEDRLVALMAGFQLHLAKPVDGAILVQALAGLAGRVAA